MWYKLPIGKSFLLFVILKKYARSGVFFLLVDLLVYTLSIMEKQSQMTNVPRNLENKGLLNKIRKVLRAGTLVGAAALAQAPTPAQAQYIEHGFEADNGVSQTYSDNLYGVTPMYDKGTPESAYAPQNASYGSPGTDYKAQEPSQILNEKLLVDDSAEFVYDVNKLANSLPSSESLKSLTPEQQKALSGSATHILQWLKDNNLFIDSTKQ